MASVPSPERPVVLRRLGIIKDPDEGTLQNSRAQRDVRQDALELFGTEDESSPQFGQWLNAIGGGAAAAIRFTLRSPIVGLVLIASIALLASIWGINRYFGSDDASPAQQEQAAVAADDAAASSLATADQTTRRARASNAGTGNSNTGPAQELAVPNGGENGAAALVTPTGATSPPEGLNDGAPLGTATGPVAAATADPAGALVDETIYSERDPDVVPPQTAERLPGPTISRWSTRTNAMEVIVSETGAVERVKLVTPPQRMPDILVLGRAKMWKFAPATKEGKPVRYRLLLTWEVNP